MNTRAKTKRTRRPLPANVTKAWAEMDEACKLIGCSRQTIWRMCDSQRLLGRDYLGRKLVSRASIRKYLADTLHVV